jgi:hypothetical protein
MQIWVRAALVIGLALGGVPHVYCSCGCAAARQRSASPACRACCGGHARQMPEKSRPCRCRTCDVVKAVAADSSTSVPALEPTWRVFPAPTAASVQLVPIALANAASRAELPGPSFAPSGCALSLLLGRLLL